jgi:predicted nuclease of predicted toxin-antitoxin system
MPMTRKYGVLQKRIITPFSPQILILMSFFNQYGFPPKIIWLRTGKVPTKNIELLLNKHQLEIQSFVKKEKCGVSKL